MLPDPRDAPARGTVLLAEDDECTRAICARILREAGYEVVIAEDGTVALERLHERPVDLLITDAMMPNMDGFELVRTMRSERELQRTPVLFLSALGTAADRCRGFRVGADGYLLKPVRPLDLVDEVDSLLLRAVSTRASMSASALSGRLDLLSPIAVLVFLHSQEQSGVLRMSRFGGDGEITIERGQPIAARLQKAIFDEEALAALLGWNAGTFRFDPGDVSAVQRKLFGPLPELLLRAETLRKAP
jgi:CheY-like chemotaxis protein